MPPHSVKIVSYCNFEECTAWRLLAISRNAGESASYVPYCRNAKCQHPPTYIQPSRPCAHLRRPESISIDRRSLSHVQQRVRGRIQLKAGIGVESSQRPRVSSESIPRIECVFTDCDVFRILLRRMCVQRSIVLVEVDLLFDREILVSEEHDTAFCN